MSNNEFDHSEGSYEEVKAAITRRIEGSLQELIEQFGLGRVQAAIEDEALSYQEARLEEIGSSDISCWVLNVKDRLTSIK